MAAERLEKEVIQIFELIDDNRNFLLSGEQVVEKRIR